jgi:hypothetical protein
MMIVLLLGFICISASAVKAAGDKNRGDIGIGDTYENNCEEQPCFDDAPQPGPSELTVSDSGPETEADEEGIVSIIIKFFFGPN